MISPFAFIPVAERTGLIQEIDKWVLRAAFRQSSAWNTNRHQPVNMAINISARRFQKENFPQVIADLLAENKQDPGNITLEITENMVMDDIAAAMKTMHALKKLGVSIAIDDFGTGYSSLSYLKKFPVDILKIDRSFVMDLPDDADDKIITISILHLAHNLGLSVVAEGVETVKQLEFLQYHGCEEVQGYLLGRPVPAQDFAELMADHQALHDLVKYHFDQSQQG